jgi:S-adenosylmethionine decarboxylase
MNNLPYYQHCVAKISFGEEFKIDEVLVDKIAGLLIDELKLTVVSLGKHEFTNDGLTKFWVLSQSHLVIHTWPEFKFIHIDIMTCNQQPTMEKIIKEILMSFGVSGIEVVKLEY